MQVIAEDRKIEPVREWSGSVEEARNERSVAPRVITHPESFEILWKAWNEAVPEIDFSKSIVIAEATRSLA